MTTYSNKQTPTLDFLLNEFHSAGSLSFVHILFTTRDPFMDPYKKYHKSHLNLLKHLCIYHSHTVTIY